MNKVKYHQTAVQIYRYERSEIPPTQVFVTLACKNTGRKETYNVSCALECFASAVGGMNEVKYHQTAVQVYRNEQGEIPPNCRAGL